MNKSVGTDRALIDVNEAARSVHRSPETIRRWVWSGRLMARRQGRRLLVQHGDVLALAGRGGAVTLPVWAEAARRTAAGHTRLAGGSAADLILADRRARAGEGPDE